MGFLDFLDELVRNFCHLGMHSQYSFLHSTLSVEQICRRAAHDGQHFAALADINTMAGVIPFIESCQKFGLKPVVGVDFRVPNGEAVLEATLLARTQQGYAILCKLVSHLHLSGLLKSGSSLINHQGDNKDDLNQNESLSLHQKVAHPLTKKPFDFISELLQLSDDIIVITGNVLLLNRLSGETKARLYAAIFTDGPDFRRPWTNTEVICTAEALNLPMIAIHPVFFNRPPAYNVYKTLRAVDHNALVSFLSPNLAGSPSWYWVSRDDMIARLPSPAPVFAIRHILEQITFSMPLGRLQPVLYRPLATEVGLVGEHKVVAPPAGFNQHKLLIDLTRAAFRKRYQDAGIDYQIQAGERMLHELQVIDKLGFAGYFLIAHDVVRHARKQRFPYIGRGSGANSFVAFLLGITQVNPLVLDLYFERFLNPARESPPDFDLDFSWRDRDEMLLYAYKRFGLDHVAMLSTHVRLKGKGAVRAIGRTLGVTDKQLSEWTRKLPSTLYDDLSLMQKKHPKSAGLDLTDPTLQHLLQAAQKLQGAPASFGVHAGGILITGAPITQFTALTSTPKGLPVTQIDMYGAESLGLLKLDILSTRGLGVLSNTLAYARKIDPKVDDKISDARVILSDERAKETLRSAETVGIFYVESPGMRSLLKKLKIDKFLDLTIASSIIRPGVSSSGMMQAYIERHRAIYHAGRPKNEVIPSIDPDLDQLLSETCGVMVFQEDVLKVAHEWAGLSLEDADLLRRAMSGKNRSSAQMLELTKKFRTECLKKGRSLPVAREIWRQMVSFAGYSFCKSHSASYAMLSMQQAWLKSHYPAAFMVSVLRNGGGFYHPQVYVLEARRLGISVYPPCILQSDWEDTLVNEGGKPAIRIGLGRIKSIGKMEVQSLLAVRKRGAFTSLSDLMRRVSLSEKTLESLIDVGGMDIWSPAGDKTRKHRRKLMWMLKALRHQIKNTNQQLFNFDDLDQTMAELPEMKGYSPAEILHTEMQILDLPVSANPVELIPDKKWKKEKWLPSSEMHNVINKPVTMIGWLLVTKWINTRKDSKQMAFLTLYDGKSAFYEAVLFPKIWQRYAQYLSTAQLYQVKGIISIEYDIPTLEVLHLSPLDWLSVI